jgi:hypothetical protein
MVGRYVPSQFWKPQEQAGRMVQIGRWRSDLEHIGVRT